MGILEQVKKENTIEIKELRALTEKYLKESYQEIFNKVASEERSFIVYTGFLGTIQFELALTDLKTYSSLILKSKCRMQINIEVKHGLYNILVYNDIFILRKGTVELFRNKRLPRVLDEYRLIIR